MAGSFYETVTAAINDFAAHGFDSEDRLVFWMEQIRQAAVDSLISEDELAEQLRRVLGAAWERLVERGRVLGYHPGVSRFTIEWIKPKLRAELDRRIVNAANLIKLNREQTIARTLQRFSGWATSIPIGGTRTTDRRETKQHIRAELASLPFRERRVLITSAHQLNSSISSILAEDAGAIAADWRSHFQQQNYNFREDHRDRDRRYRGDDWVYLMRNSWAHRERYVKPGEAGFTDEITQPGFEPFCRCYYHYLYSLDRLPESLLTSKGKEALASSRSFVA